MIALAAFALSGCLGVGAASDRILAGDLAAGRDVQVTPHSRPEYRQRMFGRPAVKAAVQK